MTIFRGDLFYFLSLGLKSAPGSCILYNYLKSNKQKVAFSNNANTAQTIVAGVP